MSRRFAAVVFDLDGLLIDSESVYFNAAQKLLQRYDREFDAEFMHTLMGAPARDGLPRFQQRFELAIELDELALQFRNAFMTELAGSPVKLMPGAAELVRQLSKSEMPIAIATSSARTYVEQVLAPHGIIEHFRYVLTADDVTHGKPHPEIYQLAAERLGIDPSTMAVLEDSDNGIRAAKAVGATCIAVPHDFTPAEHVAIADLVVGSLEDETLIEFLGLK